MNIKSKSHFTQAQCKTKQYNRHTHCTERELLQLHTHSDKKSDTEISRADEYVSVHVIFDIFYHGEYVYLSEALGHILQIYMYSDISNYTMYLYNVFVQCTQFTLF